ncbi:ATPase [Pseudomonas resinovorans]|uniref:ATPase n=1 Tax=Metapseudomonas resinovorans TaxID=53412 RepID=UPI00237F48E6|nr:ATPase [Pseudomonas resinovorans]MDE3739398.1 ATPase [Pseudomonas resinovorans]
MQKGITKLLKDSPGLKAREISKKLNLDRADVSTHLHGNLHLYHQDASFRWFLWESVSFDINILSRSAWVSSEQFESALKSSGSPHDSDFKNVVIKLPIQCKVKLCAAAKILAISNQMAAIGKNVTIDFSESEDAVSYLNRAGFFDRLHSSVKIIPKRPKKSAAQHYNANSSRLVELHPIGVPGGENVPERLKKSFIDVVGSEHANILFHAVGELVSNVEEHAGSKQPGFAGLQCYRETPTSLQIMTVVSDSGMGICGTLRPVLERKYPELAVEFDDKTPAANPKLIVHAFMNRGLSSVDDEGRGGGLKNSTHPMEVLNGKLSIRQENFSVTLRYSRGEVSANWVLDLPRILGTHIISELRLTNRQKSA